MKSVTTEIRLSDCHHCWHYNSNTNGNWCTFTDVSAHNSPHEYHKGRVWSEWYFARHKL